jgi:glutathione S-transferase
MQSPMPEIERAPPPVEVTLLHVPPSFYSQIARLGLVEKGVSYRERFVIPGPPAFDSYRPWYLRLNPQGTVPTLLLDGAPTADSRDILEQLDARFDGPRLVPDDPAEQAAMQDWVARGYAIPIRVLTYGSPRVRKIGVKLNRKRLRRLERWGRRHPDLESVYAAKRQDIEGLAKAATEEETVAAVHARLGGDLDALDGILRDRTFVAGSRYSLADVVWTVLIARSIMMGFAPLEGRPALERWYGSMKARPSFAVADVWERFRPQALLKVLASRYGVQALVVALLAGGLVWVLTALG